MGIRRIVKDKECLGCKYILDRECIGHYEGEQCINYDEREEHKEWQTKNSTGSN